MPLDSAGGRRDRPVNAGVDMVTQALAQKVMHGWLQNRHQTLVPLTLNMRVMTQTQRTLVASALAALLLAGRPREAAQEQAAAMRAWLVGLGAEPPVVGAFDAAMQAPPPLDRVIEQARELDVPVFVFAAGLVASDPRFPASLLLCDVLQARFELPSAAVRSVTRRYRRSFKAR